MDNTRQLNNCPNSVIMMDENSLPQGWLDGVTINYQEVRLPDGWLAFRFDPNRGIVEIQRRGQKYFFDLTQLVRANQENEQSVR